MTRPPIATSSALLASDAGGHIACDVRFDPSAGRRPAVVICHSFMAFKDWGFFPHAGTVLAEEGITTVTFNFSGNGVSSSSPTWCSPRGWARSPTAGGRAR